MIFSTNGNFLIKETISMTTYICFIIAMICIYIFELLDGGFDLKDCIAYFIMLVVLGAHVYLSTRKKALWGIVIPIVIVISFYPVYRIIKPIGSELLVLIGLYFITIVSTLYVWYKARKSDK